MTQRRTARARQGRTDGTPRYYPARWRRIRGRLSLPPRPGSPALPLHPAIPPAAAGRPGGPRALSAAQRGTGPTGARRPTRIPAAMPRRRQADGRDAVPGGGCRLARTDPAYPALPARLPQGTRALPPPYAGPGDAQPDRPRRASSAPGSWPAAAGHRPTESHAPTAAVRPRHGTGDRRRLPLRPELRAAARRRRSGVLRQPYRLQQRLRRDSGSTFGSDGQDSRHGCGGDSGGDGGSGCGVEDAGAVGATEGREARRRMATGADQRA